jgi:hypothetical protein
VKTVCVVALAAADRRKFSHGRVAPPAADEGAQAGRSVSFPGGEAAAADDARKFAAGGVQLPAGGNRILTGCGVVSPSGYDTIVRRCGVPLTPADGRPQDTAGSVVYTPGYR